LILDIYSRDYKGSKGNKWREECDVSIMVNLESGQQEYNCYCCNSSCAIHDGASQVRVGKAIKLYLSIPTIEEKGET
jgi:hypothetical protein